MSDQKAAGNKVLAMSEYIMLVKKAKQLDILARVLNIDEAVKHILEDDGSFT